MGEWRLVEEDAPPEWTTPKWYEEREVAPHLEQEGHKERLEQTAEFVRIAVQRGARQVVDLGAGDGGLLSLVSRLPLDAVHGYDLQRSNVDGASSRRVDVTLRDVVKDTDWEQGIVPETCLVATEMLEHLVDPHDFILRMYRTGARWAVISSPYTENDIAHYEFHTWAWDLLGYRKLAEDAGWKVIDRATVWISQILLLERR